MPACFEIRTSIAAPASVVWHHATTPEGIRYELSPLLRMTFPKEVAELNEQTVPIGRRLCRSWMLLFGFLPVDCDDVTIVALDEGRRFLERSPMLSMRQWQHERIVDPEGAGCLVTDRITATPRLLLPRWLARAVVRVVFTHRHRRLARRFGEQDPPASGPFASEGRGATAQ